MASWVSLAPEAWFGFALLLVIIAATAGVTLGRSANPRMEFFFDLMSGFPESDDHEGRTVPLAAVRSKEERSS
jgi:hypothetical protein